MKAITVKRLAPTSTKPARIKASDLDGNSLVRPRRSYMEYKDDCDVLVIHFCQKMEWTGGPGIMYSGATKEGLVYVFADPDSAITVSSNT